MPIPGVAVRQKATRMIKDSWQTQANLSFFLILLVLISFVLPSMGFGKNDLRVYANMGFSIMLISGVAIAWGWPRLFWFAAPIGCLTLILRWMDWWQGTITT